MLKHPANVRVDIDLIPASSKGSFWELWFEKLTLNSPSLQCYMCVAQKVGFLP